MSKLIVMISVSAALLLSLGETPAEARHGCRDWCAHKRAAESRGERKHKGRWFAPADLHYALQLDANGNCTKLVTHRWWQ